MSFLNSRWIFGPVIIFAGIGCVSNAHRGNSYLSLAYLLGFFGALLNGIAVMSNGGKMPCLTDAEDAPISPRHRKITPETKAHCLCDVFDVGFGFASVGDFCIVAAFLLGAIAWFEGIK